MLMNFLFKNEIIDYEFTKHKDSETVLFLHGWGGNKFSFQQTIQHFNDNNANHFTNTIGLEYV